MPVAYQPLTALRLTGIMREFQDVRLLPRELLFLNRTAVVDATDGEIMAYYTGRVQIADLVADDAQAVTYNNGTFRFETTTVPNLKLGINYTQEQINQLQAIMSNSGIANDQVGVLSWMTTNIEALLLGIRQRMEALLVAEAIDALNYNRLGIVITNGSWGMPADLKVTVSNFWTDTANATPVNDVQGLRLVAQQRYGKTYNRLTMSLQAFRYMIATAEYQAKARTYLAPNVSFSNLATANIDQQKQLAQSVLGVEVIEFYDSRFWSQSPDGVVQSYRFLPINQIVFSNTDDDNSAASNDFANAIVTESIVASLGATAMVGVFGGPQRGPVSFATVPPMLNPPNVTQWGVARGFPRRHDRAHTAVLTAGYFTDTISPTVPV